MAPSPEEAVNPVTRRKSLKAIFVGYGAPEATSKEFCSSKTISCLLRSQFSSDVDLGFADCNPRPGFPDKTPCSRGHESQGVDTPPAGHPGGLALSNCAACQVVLEKSARYFLIFSAEFNEYAFATT